MPTENRSSNTEMVSVPRKLTSEMREAFHASYEAYEDGHGECPDSQWISMLQAAPKPAPQPHPDPIAWMVGTAFWWTKEEAERDAAETGLPIVGLGAMTGAAPAEQHRGEPVAWMDPRSPQMHATISNEVKQHNLKFGGAPASAVNGYTIPLYTHADPGDVERLRADLEEWKKRCQYNADTAHDVGHERDTLRAQLAEAHALLREIHDGTLSGYQRWSKIEDLLNASAESSALPDPLGCNECTHAECGKFDGPRQVECRAMADNACARSGASS